MTTRRRKTWAEKVEAQLKRDDRLVRWTCPDCGKGFATDAPMWHVALHHPRPSTS